MVTCLTYPAKGLLHTGLRDIIQTDQNRMECSAKPSREEMERGSGFMNK